MEQFIVSARKYRPQTFEDVVGQEAITNTLENAIRNNHLAQALLFTGPRGVGKTSCARILAKRINEVSSTAEDEDYAFNIFELDAASNNSVDDIRNLTDQVRIPPQVGKFKVYIIDEVHMLSAAAFNAFLKTLEEPPAHAIFILATTEKHKIIPTILSRCQIFDFKRIGVLDAKNFLKKIAAKEGINADDDGLHIIAQKADGAMRDALSIFDRVVSFSGKELTREAVTENLNVLDYDEYFKMTDLLLANDIPAVLIQFNSILSRGFDGHHFISGLASHFRDLLVAKDKVTIDLLEVGDNAKKKYLEQSQKCDMRFLLQAIDLANDCDLKYKASKNQRLLVELTLMQLASITFDGEKKNSKPYIIAAVHFREKVRKRPTPKFEPKKEVEQAFDPATVKPKAPAKPVKLSQETRRTSPLSLKSLQKQKEIEEIEVEVEDLSKKPATPYTQNELLYAWNSYAKDLEQKGRKSLSSILTGSKPKVDKDYNIHFEVYSKPSLAQFNQGKNGLLGYIKEKLNNFHIEIITTVNEAEILKKAYTPHEKFAQMAKKNKSLEDLKRKFNLEL